MTIARMFVRAKKVPPSSRQVATARGGKAYCSVVRLNVLGGQQCPECEDGGNNQERADFYLWYHLHFLPLIPP